MTTLRLSTLRIHSEFTIERRAWQWCSLRSSVLGQDQSETKKSVLVLHTVVLIFVLQDHYDDECYKIVFHKTTPELQDQDRNVQDQDRFFGLRPVLS